MITDRIGRHEVLLTINQILHFPRTLEPWNLGKVKKTVKGVNFVQNFGFPDLVIVAMVIILKFVTASFKNEVLIVIGLSNCPVP